MSVHWPILRRCLTRPFEVAMVDDQREWKRIELLVAGSSLAAASSCCSRARAMARLWPRRAGLSLAAYRELIGRGRAVGV